MLTGCALSTTNYTDCHLRILRKSEFMGYFYTHSRASCFSKSVMIVINSHIDCCTIRCNNR